MTNDMSRNEETSKIEGGKIEGCEISFRVDCNTLTAKLGDGPDAIERLQSLVKSLENLTPKQAETAALPQPKPLEAAPRSKAPVSPRRQEQDDAAARRRRLDEDLRRAGEIGRAFKRWDKKRRQETPEWKLWFFGN